MGKIPTSFSMDVAMEDEKDDIPAKRSKYLTGRMTASDLRLRSSIGTQRVHGAGQNKQFEAGSQHVMHFAVGESGQMAVRDNYAAGQSWVDLGTYAGPDGKDNLYGFFYKIDVKSLVWYSPENPRSPAH